MKLTEFLEARIAEDEAEAKNLQGETDFGLEAAGDRMLAECAAKRELLEQRKRIDQSMSMDDWSAGWSDGNYAALNALAAVYKDHPDYREEWSSAT